MAISQIILGFKNTLFINPNYTINALKTIYPYCVISTIDVVSNAFVIQMVNKMNDKVTKIEFEHCESQGIQGARKIIAVREVE